VNQTWHAPIDVANEVVDYYRTDINSIILDFEKPSFTGVITMKDVAYHLGRNWNFYDGLRYLDVIQVVELMRRTDVSLKSVNTYYIKMIVDIFSEWGGDMTLCWAILFYRKSLDSSFLRNVAHFGFDNVAPLIAAGIRDGSIIEAVVEGRIDADIALAINEPLFSN